MSNRFQLIALEGPAAGVKVEVIADSPVVLGRTTSGMHLADSLVNKQHAEVYVEDERLWVKDLDSTHGTFVNGRRAGQEPMELKIGMRMQIGESIIEVRGLRAKYPQWAVWLAFLLVLLSTPFVIQISQYAGGVASSFLNGAPPIVLQWDTTIRQSFDYESQALVLDECFMSETGLGDDAVISRVTDLNGDQIDEVWLTGPGMERVYTFTDHGDADGKPEWRLVGKFPEGCTGQVQKGGFPVIRCAGDTYYNFSTLTPNADESSCAQSYERGVYTKTRQEGVIAWMKDRHSGLLHPYKFTFSKRDVLADFLGNRRINEPVHLLVCEDAVSGMSAHVLTASGRMQEISPGCINDMELIGPRADELFGTDVPVAVAFTATGRNALIEHGAIFLSGTPDRHFMNDYGVEIWRSLSAEPDNRPAVVFSFLAPGVRTWNPIAQENHEIKIRGRIKGQKEFLNVQPYGKSAIINKDGYVAQARCGPSILAIKTETRDCTGFCGSSSTFMLIQEQSEELKEKYPDPWEVPYSAGPHFFHNQDVQVEVRLQLQSKSNSLKVLSASVGWRTTAPCDG